jgi:hypothetical protein
MVRAARIRVIGPWDGNQTAPAAEWQAYLPSDAILGPRIPLGGKTIEDRHSERAVLPCHGTWHHSHA